MDMRQPLLSEISRRNKLALLSKCLAPRSNLLEVGTGDGWFARKLRECGHEVVTIDLNAPAEFVGNILDWRNLGLKAKSFDAVIALEVIEHVNCLNSICTLCKDGGLIMLSSPHPSWDWAMKVLESLHLTQRRTSEHHNLTDFCTINLKCVFIKRPLFIHQVALFVNTCKQQKQNKLDCERNDMHSQEKVVANHGKLKVKIFPEMTP